MKIKRRTLLGLLAGTSLLARDGLSSSHASQPEARWLWSRGAWHSNRVVGIIRQWVGSASVNLEVVEAIRRRGPEYSGLDMNENEFLGAPPYSLMIRKVLTIPAQPLLIPPTAKSVLHAIVELEQHQLPFRKHEVKGHDFGQLFSGGNTMKREVF